MNVREDSIHPKSQIVFAASANHLVGPCQHVGRNREADLLRRFEIDDELKLGRLLDRQMSGLRAFQDFVHVPSSSLTVAISVGAVRE
jgi:hypothetical protein